MEGHTNGRKHKRIYARRGQTHGGDIYSRRGIHKLDIPTEGTYTRRETCSCCSHSMIFAGGKAKSGQKKTSPPTIFEIKSECMRWESPTYSCCSHSTIFASGKAKLGQKGLTCYNFRNQVRMYKMAKPHLQL